MTDPELVEQIARVLEGFDFDEPNATEECATALATLIASREAAAAERMRAEIVAWLDDDPIEFGSSEFADYTITGKIARAIESSSFRTGEG